MYAGDLVIVSNTPEGLQGSLDILHDYCNRWKLTVKNTKSQVLVCKQSDQRRQNEVWFHGDQLLVECAGYSYLGITFTTGGITNISLNVLTGRLSRVFRHQQHLDISTHVLPLYCVMVHVSGVICPPVRCKHSSINTVNIYWA